MNYILLISVARSLQTKPAQYINYVVRIDHPKQPNLATTQPTAAVAAAASKLIGECLLR